MHCNRHYCQMSNSNTSKTFKPKQQSMSATDEFSSFTKKVSQDVTYPRNAVSTVKKERHRRNFIDIRPLHLAELKKELEEEEPVPLWQHRPVAEDYKEEDHDNAGGFNKENNFPRLQTPAKLVPTYPKANRTLDFQFATPNNKAPPPRVQCSVNMNRYLRTPISRIVETSEDEIRQTDLKPIAPSPLPLLSKFHKFRVNDVEYVSLNILGKGGSSEVFHCFDVERKTHRAIKIVSLESSTSAAGFLNEINILKTLEREKCNRIIKMFDFQHLEEEKILLVVLEVGGADLSKILKERASTTDHIPIYMLVYYWMEMLMAVKQIHDRGIIHSDLKPANFLQVGGYLKLIDFGIATSTQTDMTSALKTVPEGSFNYISPEAVRGEVCSNPGSSSDNKPTYKIRTRSDVWSLGCILYQLVYRKTPFQYINNIFSKLAAVGNPNHTIEYAKADWLPQKILKTLKKCLQYKAELRPTVDELIAEYENFFHNL